MSKKAAALALIAAYAAKQTLDKGSLSFIGERNGKIVAELHNGKVFELFSVNDIRGKDGSSGVSIAGKDGKDGHSIEAITQSDDHSIHIELSDGKQLRFALPEGKAGQDGKPGAKGDRGIGVPGQKGDKGDKGDQGNTPKHEWRGTELRFEREDGSWGEWVDLKGQPGRDGRKGYVINGDIAENTQGNSGVQSVVAGAGLVVDNTDPQNPVVSANGTGNQEVFIGEQPAIAYPAVSFARVGATNYFRQSVHVVV